MFLFSSFKNKQVIIRTFSAGVHYGTLIDYEDKHAPLTNSKRIWKWEGAFTLHEIALFGLKKTSMISESVPSILLTEVIEILPCSEEAIKNLNQKNWAAPK